MLPRFAIVATALEHDNTRARELCAGLQADEVVVLSGPRGRKDYPPALRRVRAWVEVDGREREMVFLTNNLDWAATSIVDLYGCRWEIEVFFKELKQTVQLVDFLGNSENAVKWQVWTALLVHLLLRLLAWRHGWPHSFSRMVTYMRAALWLPRSLAELLAACGTAAVSRRCCGAALQAWLPGFAA